MKICPQEVWYAEFPFEDQPDVSKERPVIVLDVSEETATVLSIMVTSSDPRDEFDIEIFDWEFVPLRHRSTARVSRTMSIRTSSFRRKIGRLTDDDWDNVTDLYVRYLDSPEARF